MTRLVHCAARLAARETLQVFCGGMRVQLTPATRASQGRANFIRLSSAFLLSGLISLLPQAVHGEGTVYSASEAELDAALAGGGLVTLAFDGTITITNTKVVTANTILDATGQDVTISGGNTVTMFAVNAGVSLTLSNLTLADGLTSSNGGAIYNRGNLTAFSCVFTDNQVVGTNGTAGADGKDHDITNGDDGHSGTAGASVSGGAIYNSGQLALTACSFLNNSAYGGAGGDGGRGGNSGWGGGDGGNGGVGGFARGGAVFSTNSVAITNCTFADNIVVGGDAGNGGDGGSGGALGDGLAGGGRVGGEASGAGVCGYRKSVVVNSTFSGNAAWAGKTGDNGIVNGAWNGRDGQTGGVSLGGGLCNLGTNATINCTFYSNSVTGGDGGNASDGVVGGDGGNGGAGWGGGFYSAGVAGVTNCTFSAGGAYGGVGGTNGLGSLNDGSPGNTGATRGGNIARASGTYILKNCIMAYQDSGGNGYGTVTDAGQNMSSDNSIPLNGAGSLVNTDPQLGPLDDNGGLTKTMALLTNSPAIDAADTDAGPETDQRGVSRPIGEASDMGAFEYGLLVRGRVTLDGIGVAGVMVSTGDQTSTTDADGYYLLGVGPGEYVITPSSAKYEFDPPFLEVTVTEDTFGVDFSAIQLFAISGRVLDGANGIANAIVSLGSEALAQTDANGKYSFAGLGAGDYELSASLNGYSFDPPTLSVTVGPDQTDANFYVGYTISGRVLDGPIGLGGVTVSAENKTALTDANGEYSITNVHAGTYFVFASLAGYTFSPAQQVTLGPNASSVDFSVEAPLYTISGRVTEGGIGLGGVQIYGSRTTDANGNYRLSLQEGIYVLTPFKAGYGFIPKNYTVNLSSDTTNLDFIAGPYISSFTYQTNGEVRLFLYAPAGQANSIQASTNLTDWVNLVTNSGPYQYLDKNAPQFPTRFYRSARPR